MSGKYGFTYTAVLAMIVIISIAVTSAQKSWTTVIKREKEKELMFRGDQIRNAISYYYNSINNKPEYPHSLKDLLKDPRYPSIRRHLRKIYKDPITGSNEWGLIYTQGGRIKGVFSKSPEEPFKKSDFDPPYSHFQNKTHYFEWKFLYQPN